MARWRRVLRLSLLDWWLLLRIGLLLLLIRAGLSLLTFKRMRRLVAWAGRKPVPVRTAPSSELARLVWAVSRLSRFILADAPCLTQALAVQLLFARRGVETELRIGVAKATAGALEAHAWVEHDGKVVIGGVDSPQRFTPLPSIENIGL